MPSSNSSRRPPIAIVGASALFPGSVDAQGFWKNILAGADLMGDVPANRWLIDDYYDPDLSAPDKTYVKRGAFLPEVDFDALGWGVPPSIVPATDTSQLLALIVARRVLEDACGKEFTEVDQSRTSVILGVTSGQELLGDMASRLQRPVWLKSLREAGIPEDEAQKICDNIASHYAPWQESTFPGLLGNVVAGRIANRLNLGGTNCVTDAACASTFSAVSMGVNELYLGDSDMVIAGGVDTMNDIFMYMCFSKTPALSRTGDCRPFSSAADGTMLGEGLGMMALRRLDDAERDGNKIYAVLRGVGSSSDGRAKSVYAPLAAGQSRALRAAYEIAGYSPSTVELVEAHGTGTKAGDAAEFEGLRTVFEETGRPDRQWCALGSVKSQVGHTKAAAGAAGLFKAVMALRHRVLPPTIKVDEPNEKLDLGNSPFHLNTRARPWVRDGEHPRRASVSSFGFGGSNFHLALEEYTGPGTLAHRLRTAMDELVVLTSDSATELARRAREHAESATATKDGFLQWLSRTSQEAFQSAANVRLAIVARDDADLAAKLEQAAAAIERGPGEAFSTPGGIHFGLGSLEGRVGFLFPGQGSQYRDMAARVSMHFERAMEAWESAAETLRSAGEHLHDVVFPRPAFTDAERDAQDRRLTATEWAQPAIGCASLSFLALLASLGVQPHAVAGHSFGEVTALHAAGVISAEDLLRVARRRGELMAEAAAIPGSMTAVSRPVEEIRPLLDAWGVDVVVANHNSPTQVVLSGSDTAIADVEQRLSAEGIRAQRLPVATAFHSPVVAASAAPFLEFLETIEFAASDVSVYANTTAGRYPDDTDAARRILAEQIANPVRFVEMIDAMYESGVRTFVEVGPGSVLTGLVGRIMEDRPHVAVSVDRKGATSLAPFLDALGRLAAAGVPMEFSELWREYAPVPDPHVETSRGPTLRLSGGNTGKSYPPPGGTPALPPPNPARAETTPAALPSPTLAASPAPSAAPVTFAAPAAGSVPSASPSAAPTAAAPSPPDLAWIAAYQEIQRQTADAHAAYQRTMAESHAAFLRTAETSFQGLTRMLTGAELELPPAPAATAPPAHVPPPAAAFAPPPLPPAPVAAPAAAPAVPVPPPIAPQAAPVAAPAAAPAPEVPVPPPIPGAAAEHLETLLLEVVADKTGYPADMLTMEMELEGDLGIDSIKRVEILSAMQERSPGLPEVDASEMLTLNTLGSIVGYMRQQAPETAPHAAPSSGPSTAPATTSPALDLEPLLLEVVADKTGYPADMLTMEMELEGDLGIDSIKRVEILSAMQERAPGLPEVDPGEMLTLNTLGSIVAYMRAKAPTTAAAPAPAAPKTPAAPTTAAAPAPFGNVAELAPLLLEVVAEKTGYPADMLTMEMELEGDLGIDSIKRVEILSGLQDRAPGLPEVDPGEMLTLNTLGSIVAYMQGKGDVAPAAPVAPVAPAAEPTHAPSGVAPATALAGELGRYTLATAPAAAAGMALPGLLGDGRVVVTDDGGGVAAALVAELGRRDVTAEVVADVPAEADAVIFLGGLREAASVDDAVAVNREAFRAARAAAPRMSRGDGLFVTVQDTGGEFGLSEFPAERAWLAGVTGLARTAAQEWGGSAVKAIDLARGGRGAAALAAAIADELLSGGPELEVGLPASGGRRGLRSVRNDIEDEDVGQDGALLGESDVVVVSGGARGVTATSIVTLARATRSRFVLLGRTQLEDEPACCAGADDDATLKRVLLHDARERGESPSPADLGRLARRVLANREIRGTVAQIEGAGGAARYVSVDVTDAAALGAALEGVRADWGPVTALVHGAGVIADKLIAEKSDEQFDRVFDTKVEGLRALLAATAADPLRAICLFSSVSARCGNVGQSDYAMANEVLNKVAVAESRRRGSNCLVKSLGWGPWDGGMVGPELRERFAALGVPLIPLQAGGRMFANEMATPSEVEVVLGGEPRSTPLLASDGPRTLTLDVVIGRGSHPYLASHAIEGTPVVPVVLAVEWFARAAQAARPDLVLGGIRDVKVVRGIRLTGFDNGGDRVHVHCRELSNGDGAVMGLEVRGADGAVHYTSEADMVVRRETPENGGSADPSLEDWGTRTVYGDVLFHGPEFQVIEEMDGVSDEGISATLRGIREAGWSDESWRTDAAAFDGGLQLALLWSRHVLGGATLPTSIGEVRTFTDDPPVGPLHCVLRGRRAGNSRTVSDVAFTDGDGRLVAEFRRVETHLLPGQPAVAGTAHSV